MMILDSILPVQDTGKPEAGHDSCRLPSAGFIVCLEKGIEECSMASMSRSGPIGTRPTTPASAIRGDCGQLGDKLSAVDRKPD